MAATTRNTLSTSHAPMITSSVRMDRAEWKRARECRPRSSGFLLPDRCTLFTAMAGVPDLSAMSRSCSSMTSLVTRGSGGRHGETRSGFIGNFDRSAKEGFPLYRISGGAGFIWAASFDQKGRGTLRLVAVDTSAFYSELIAKSLPSETRESIRAGNVEVNPIAAERPSAGANLVRQRAEKAEEQATADSEVAREEFETAKRDVQLAKTEIESLNAERARLKAAVERLESDKIAAENKAQVMKSVAYGTFVIALMAIVSSLFFVIRKKSTGPKWIGPEPIPIQATGHSSVADDPLPFKWSDLKYVFDIKKDRNGKEAIQA